MVLGPFDPERLLYFAEMDVEAAPSKKRSILLDFHVLGTYEAV